ncbi:MAG: hypothetical protein IJW88_03115 [Alistipes sp.]|nr:hypothetical protein [Alistipes sp.]
MKKIFIAISAAVVSMATIISLCSFTSSDECSTKVCTEVSCEGKNCNGTVGCNCPGFAPIQNQEVWKQSYCKHCGHHRNSHR